VKSYTDLEQSKKLAEILPLESADMCYRIVAYNPDNTHVYQSYCFIGTLESDIPCWSLAALMHLLPSEFIEKGKYSETTYEIKIRKYRLTDEVNLHQIAYGSYKFYEDGSSSWKDMVNTGEKEYLLDAAFEMVCWLKENGKI
jgi:hypothetical protein